MRTRLAGEAEGVCSEAGGGVIDSSGEIDRAGDSSGGADGVDDCCATATWTKAAEATKATIRNLNIVPPIHVWEQVIAPLAIT
jgi:hypothetical protein